MIFTSRWTCQQYVINIWGVKSTLTPPQQNSLLKLEYVDYIHEFKSR